MWCAEVAAENEGRRGHREGEKQKAEVAVPPCRERRLPPRAPQRCSRTNAIFTADSASKRPGVSVCLAPPRPFPARASAHRLTPTAHAHVTKFRLRKHAHAAPPTTTFFMSAKRAVEVLENWHESRRVRACMHSRARGEATGRRRRLKLAPCACRVKPLCPGYLSPRVQPARL